MGIGEAEAFSERLKRELLALEAANVHAILESEPLIDDVSLFSVHFVYIWWHFFFSKFLIYQHSMCLDCYLVSFSQTN